MMDFNFKFYGDVNVSGLKELIKDPQLNWDEYTFRQTHRKGQQDTKTIPLIWDKDFKTITQWAGFNLFNDEIKIIHEQIKSVIGDGTIITAILINLPKRKKILPHIDSGNVHFFKTNRIHIPIETNNECWFKVSDEVIHMKEGEMWEINNSFKIHSVNNDGDTDRVHLLIDYEQKNKPLI